MATRHQAAGRAALLVLVVVGIAPQVWAQKQADPSPSKTQVLLVGVTHYDHLPNVDLAGPANDVPLVASLLTEQFAVNPADIAVLTEEASKLKPDLRPTKARIERELGRIASQAKAGDQVLIYLSGHGVQELATNDPQEPDGLNEVFLPADAKRNGDGSGLDNALIDDEIRERLHKIADSGALIWLVADCCHSGTIARGAITQRERRVEPEKLFSAATAKEVGLRQLSAIATPSPHNGRAGLAPGLVALYASRSHEPTLERDFPSATRPGKQDSYGLLTYNLVKVLRSSTSASRLTYSQLLEGIRHEYETLGYLEYPVPLLEGVDRGREVLGRAVRVERPRWDLVHSGDQWKVRAGRLHGLTIGSILAVYPPAGVKKADERIGHVKVASLGTIEAQVTPCPHKEGEQDWPVTNELPDKGKCELVFYNFEKLRLKVAAVEASGVPGKPDNTSLKSLLQGIEKQPEVPLTVVADPAAGDKAQIDIKSDIFSLGAVLYELLTGQAPFEGIDLDEMLARARKCEFDRDALRRAAVPKALTATCLKAMAADPHLRHARAEELAAELERFVRPKYTALILSIAAALVVVIAFAINFRPAEVRRLAPFQDLIEVARSKDEVLQSVRLVQSPATGAQLRVRCFVPPELQASFFWFGSDGKLALLDAADVDQSPTPAGVEYLYPRGQPVALGGLPGTEFVLSCATREAAPDLATVEAAFQDLHFLQPWPALPRDSLVFMNQDHVQAEAVRPNQVPRPPAGKEDNVAADIEHRLDQLRQRLGKRYPFLAGAAMPHVD